MEHILEEGQKFGIYLVEKFLGEGAFAEVYRVNHPFFGRLAMKVFKALGMTPEDTFKIMEEPKILSKLNHPNIIRVFDAATIPTSQGERGYFTMEYIAMGNLDEYRHNYIERTQTLLPVEDVVNIARQVCRGLAAAHSNNPPIIHRDIKPQNILVNFDCDGLRARISDFGLAKNLNPLALRATSRGTIMFKPPEVFAGTYNDSLAGDVWGLGTTIYLLLTDCFPFTFDQLVEMKSGEETTPLTPPSKYNSGVNHSLDRIVAKALAPNQEKRYSSAREMLADLEKWKPGDKSNEGPVRLPEGYTSTTVISPNITEVDPAEARRLAKEALKLGHQPGRLTDAAELMEQAFRKDPQLREEYATQVILWRKGIMN